MGQALFQAWEIKEYTKQSPNSHDACILLMQIHVYAS